MPPTLQTHTGAAIGPLIPHLAALRCAIFRDYPYLYDGDEAYERQYLATYQHSPAAAIVVAIDNTKIIGASTCLPLADADPAIQHPLRAQNIDPNRVFYFGESVLQPAYRNRGLGVGFFDAREAHARTRPGTDFAAFASVLRPENHPARPAGYHPLDAFWTKRGYTRRPDLVCRLSWQETGAPHETEHELVFWMKSLSGAPLP